MNLKKVNGERLWRMRRDSQWIDARLMDGGEGVELQMFCDADMIYTRRWSTRELAVEEADRQLKELQRVGWASHW